MKMTRYALAGWLAFAATASAQWPQAPTDDKAPVDPVINPPVLEEVTSKPMLVQVEAAAAPQQGPAAFARMLIDSKAAYAKARDYMGHMIRQERVNGTLLAEQTAEIRVRTEPFAIDLKVVAPKAASGWETAYVAGRKTEFVRFRASGLSDMQSLKPNDPKTLTGTRHGITNVGLAAILARVEKMVETEKKLRNPVQIVVAEYKFENKPCLRFEIFCEKPHVQRYAHRAVLYIDAETKLPVRWEAYEGPKPGDPAGELLESISFVNMKFNTGLGDSTFDK